VRGVKGNKVLRTVKIKANNWTRDTQWEYFCDQTCLHNFIRKHYLEMVRLHPRTEPLETPVNVIKNDPDDYYYRTKIEVDESRQVG
jgi:anaerobic ribonucleoside-triphosphate reductase